ncbi:MAG: DUF2218 domain-containing protein [Prosthecobacter sp.]|jgi:hypothetical protein|uniref:DUF2218 domain-containing protein n=1 Tax=Prosthecobacter sp. TaxID=1965333 RepID=UPI0019EA4649|nr:DUF2218 domain-containing protein [Prosthecobacter sp.]MBE2284391.1 DUF2218 domain-containing protein [Prosthecobacter sp.]
MTRIETRIQTPLASRYLEMLCRHFSRKVPSEWTATRGVVDFKPGACEMHADETTLRITCAHEEPQAVERMRHIVDDHLVRFSKKEGFSMVWQPAAA